MKTLIRRGLSLVLAMTMLTSPLMALTAEAGNGNGRGRGRGNGRWKNARQERVCRTESRRVYRTDTRHVYYHHDHDNDSIVPFIGGVVVGAIIGSAARSRSERCYVYDCDCGRHYRDYDSWTEHQVIVHNVPSCDVEDDYPVCQGGHWDTY